MRRRYTADCDPPPRPGSRAGCAAKLVQRLDGYCHRETDLSPGACGRTFVRGILFRRGVAVSDTVGDTRRPAQLQVRCGVGFDLQLERHVLLRRAASLDDTASISSTFTPADSSAPPSTPHRRLMLGMLRPVCLDAPAALLSSPLAQGVLPTNLEALGYELTTTRCQVAPAGMSTRERGRSSYGVWLVDYSDGIASWSLIFRL
jgi:hypothetical protein